MQVVNLDLTRRGSSCASCTCDSGHYELDHHIRIGRRAGVSPELVERIFAGPDAEGWSERHRALLSAVDSLLRTRNIDDPGWEALRSHYSDEQLVRELIT